MVTAAANVVPKLIYSAVAFAKLRYDFLRSRESVPGHRSIGQCGVQFANRVRDVLQCSVESFIHHYLRCSRAMQADRCLDLQNRLFLNLFRNESALPRIAIASGLRRFNKENQYH